MISLRGVLGSVPRLASDTVWYGVAGAVGKALALLSVPFLTRALGSGDYGLLDLSMATAGVLTVVAMFAGDIPASRIAGRALSVDARRRAYTEYIVAVASIAVVIGSIAMLSASWVASAVWSAPDAEILVFLSAALIPISGVRAALATLHRLDGNAPRWAVLATVDVVAQLVFAVALVAAGLGALGAVIGLVGGGLLALIITAVFTRRQLASRFDPRAAAGLVSGGAPYLPPLVAFVAADYVGRALIADRVGPSAVGEFGLALRIASVLALLTAAFQAAWAPRVAAMTFGPDTRRHLGRTLMSYTISASLVCIGLVAAAPEVVDLLAGSGYEGAAAVLPGLAFASVLAGTHFVLSMGAVVRGGAWMVSISAVAGALTQVLVAVITIDGLGVLAVALGAVAGRALSVGMLGLRVAPAFGRGIVGASLVLAVVAVACLLVSVTAGEPSGSLAFRVLAGLAALGVLAVFALRSLARSHTAG